MTAASYILALQHNDTFQQDEVVGRKVGKNEAEIVRSKDCTTETITACVPLVLTTLFLQSLL